MQQQDSLLTCELRELAFPLTSSERSAIDRIAILKVDIVLEQNDSRQKCAVKASANQRPSRHSAQNVLTSSLRNHIKRCICTSGCSLEVSQLVYTSGQSQSVALRLSTLQFTGEEASPWV